MAAALGAHSRIAMLDEELTGAFDRLTGGKIKGVKLCVPNQIELNRRWHAIYRIGTLNNWLRRSMLMNLVPRASLSIRDHDRFGQVRHVCMLRDPRAVVSSIIRRDGRSHRVGLYRWQRCIHIFDELRDSAREPPCFVSFDRLVTDPETTLRRVCAELEIDFEPQMLNAPSLNERYKMTSFDGSRSGKSVHGAAVDTSSIPQTVWRIYQSLLEQAV